MSELSIVTTQNVTINFNQATVGQRIISQLIDGAVKVSYGITVYFLFFYLMGLNKYMDGLDYWSQTAIQLFFYLPVMFYTLVQESMFEGQTIGKRLLKIKVIKIDGYQAGFGDYFIRWAFRLIDIGITQGIIGLIVLATSNKTQRLGDMAAGTAVIDLTNDVNINHTILQELENNYVPLYPMVIKLTDNDVRIIKETYDTAVKMADFATIQKLQGKIEAVTGIKPLEQSPINFVDKVLKDYNYYTQKM